ncbi:Hypothetical_protein [Hexamita inflata]|uniref:Hypothetical_protein n=1 Tax=Hexamita inflata TaxID=28002 RepID=A0AA86RGK9_9EUKA|nr:Hypothetical protein HINF_LOCUS65241 [Hexamita inflata]
MIVHVLVAESKILNLAGFVLELFGHLIKQFQTRSRQRATARLHTYSTQNVIQEVESRGRTELKLAVVKYGNDSDVICAEEFPHRRVVCLKNKYYSMIYNNPAFDCQQDSSGLHSALAESERRTSPGSDRFFSMYIRDVVLTQ